MGEGAAMIVVVVEVRVFEDAPLSVAANMKHILKGKIIIIITKKTRKLNTDEK